MKKIFIISLMLIGLFLASCGQEGATGENGVSAYEIYKEYTTDDPILSEKEWLESLKGQDSKMVSSVAIECGVMTIIFDDGSSTTVEGKFSEVGHHWDEGVITTQPTCITPGIITYTCEKCWQQRKENVDSISTNHKFSDFVTTKDTHYKYCLLCGEKVNIEHKMSEWQVLEEIYNSKDYHTGTLLEQHCEDCDYMVLKAEASLGYTFLRWTTGDCRETISISSALDDFESIKPLFEVEELDLPTFYIDTQNQEEIVSKEEYIKCSISVSNALEEFNFVNFSGKIKGRGNSTWTMPKKPYKLKFDQKVNLFGNGSAKTWTLIANYCDPSLARNYMAYTLGEKFDYIGQTTTKTQFVDVYLNGEYIGVYLICEQNEVGSTRVDIENDFGKAPNPADMGYLIEIDGRASEEGVENKDYVVMNGKNYAIKSPDYEDLTNLEDFAPYVEYIKQYLIDAWNALLSRDLSQIQQYIDINTFIDSYIIHELFNMCDVGYSSFFMYKDAQGKLCSGPIWDFDISSGNCFYNESSMPNKNWAETNNLWYEELLKCNEFRDRVVERLVSYQDEIKNHLDSAKDILCSYKSSFERNFLKWDILGKPILPNTEEMIAITTWEGQVDYLLEWLNESLNYLLSIYTS